MQIFPFFRHHHCPYWQVRTLARAVQHRQIPFSWVNIKRGLLQPRGKPFEIPQCAEKRLNVNKISYIIKKSVALKQYGRCRSQPIMSKSKNEE